MRRKVKPDRVSWVHDGRILRIFLLIAMEVGFGGMLFAADGSSAPRIRERIVGQAAGMVGTVYRPGGMTPQGFDCSGLVCYLYREYVDDLPRSSRAMARWGDDVAYGELLPGDLLFFETMGTSAGITHVAIYLGSGTVVHAVSNGPETGVIVSSVESGYWNRTYSCACRVLPAAATVPDATTTEVETPSGPAGQASISEHSPEPAQQPSPWEQYDGPVYGDFAEWRLKETEEFEAYKNRDAAGAKGR